MDKDINKAMGDALRNELNARFNEVYYVQGIQPECFSIPVDRKLLDDISTSEYAAAAKKLSAILSERLGTQITPIFCDPDPSESVQVICEGTPAPKILWSVRVKPEDPIF